jgi:hypothetical protein
MRSKLSLALALFVGVGLATLALAQQPGQPGQQGGRGRGGGGFPGFGGGGGGAQSRLSLLRVAEVKKELELADEQVDALEKLDAELREKYPFGGGRGGAPGGGAPGGTRGRGPGQNQGTMTLPAPTEWYFVAQQQPDGQQGRGGRGTFQPPSPEDLARMEQQRLERAREEKAKLAEILLPHQSKRLNEIYVQQNGLNALQDEDIAKDLNISEAQKAKLAEVRDANRTAMFEQMRGGGGAPGGGGGDREAFFARMQEYRKQADAKLLAVLTPDQQKKFEAMKGKPFEMPENRGGFGGGRGPRPGGNQPNN